MSNRTLSLDERLYTYLLDSSLREPEILRKLREETDCDDMSMMRIAPEQGQFMALLVRLLGAKRVLEIGTYTGYSALWMALALPQNGELIACDVSEEWTGVAQRYWAKAGVGERVHLKLGPAIDTLDALLAAGEQEEFDLVFIDADKPNYEAYFERCLELVRTGGLILVDNVFWDGTVADPDEADESTVAIRAFNKARARDSRIWLSMLPVGDGLTLAMKKGPGGF